MMKQYIKPFTVLLACVVITAVYSCGGGPR
jgi:hypothetical protein